MKKGPILIHIPHSSLFIPKMCKKRLIKNIINENLFISDYLVDKFVGEKYNHLKFKFSRMFCDVERFNSEAEEMNKYGMGIVYTNDSNNDIFISIDNDYKNMVIEKYYNLHHKLLDEMTSSIIEKYGKCILIDLHSYSDEFVEKIFNKKCNPDICIGVENEYTSDFLKEFTVNFFEKKGYSVKINYPYSGSIIPNKYIKKKDNRLNTIMLEINKRTYLDNNLKLNKIKFKKLKICISAYLREIDTLFKKGTIK